MARPTRSPDLRPMSEFDPTKPAMVHDELNDETFEWDPERWGEDFHSMSSPHGDDMIEWDGLLLDGWMPVTRH